MQDRVWRRLGEIRPDQVVLYSPLPTVFPCFAPSRALTAPPTTTAAQYNGKGWPGLFLTHPDRGVMAIECKSARGRLTLEQSDWLDTVAAAGVDVVVARPGNYDETLETITSGIGIGGASGFGSGGSSGL